MTALGAVVFLSLQLPAPAHVATEAVSAVVMQVARTISTAGMRRRRRPWPLGAAMIVGSWTGRRLVQRMTERRFRFLVEALLVVAAVSLIVG